MNIHLVASPYDDDYAIVGLMEGLGMLVNFLTYAGVLLLTADVEIAKGGEKSWLERDYVILAMILGFNVLYMLIIISLIVHDVCLNQGRKMHATLKDYGLKIGCLKILKGAWHHISGPFLKLPCCKKCAEGRETERQRIRAASWRNVKKKAGEINVNSMRKKRQRTRVQKGWVKSLGSVTGARAAIMALESPKPRSPKADLLGLTLRRTGGTDKATKAENEQLRAKVAELEVRAARRRNHPFGRERYSPRALAPWHLLGG
jgi:hypothetical protein